MSLEKIHRQSEAAWDYQPQQSVLKRHAGHRQTACIRYISAPHRSHDIFSSALDAAGDLSSAELTGVMCGLRSGGNGSGMSAL
ncbi:MAG TPA: hypothetical protein VEK56_08000 [Vicinamibacterales bacterium]|nr:hypothetical protein [Vicinamibacterales bacterium]